VEFVRPASCDRRRTVFYRGRRLRRLHLDSPEVRKRKSEPVVDISLISTGARISIRSFSVMERWSLLFTVLLFSKVICGTSEGRNR